MYYEVIPTKMFRQDGTFLTYHSNFELQPGQVVLVPIGRSSSPAIVYRKVPKVDFPTKDVMEVLYQQPLPKHLVDAAIWLSNYYHSPLSSTANLLIPNGVTKKRRKQIAKTEQTSKLPLIELNKHQKNALTSLYEARSTTKLLHGVTGSGKTNIYLEMAARALKQQKSTILLVPEIALTSQLVRVFSDTFGANVLLIHSKQTEAERHQIWENILNSSAPHIIIGPRSALFAPVRDLGLIIVDEAHESAFYQENTPRYSALRLASFIAEKLHIDCIFGTATPLVSDYHLANQKNAVITLSQKAKASAKKPNISVINLRDRQKFLKNRYFSDELLEKIQQNLANHEQSLIFHNRRGSAPLTICEKCAWQALCPKCLLPLTLHADSYNLICHTCGHTEPIPHSCPICHHPGIIHKGFGTKLLESELHKLFKDARIARFDADNQKDNSLTALYEQVKNGEIDILIGTQTLSRGFDFPNLSLVGVVQADAGLSLPDYSAEERTFQLLTQVIGRVGRGHLDKADVVIQTFQPEHPAINFASHEDYAGFADYLLKKRRKQHFPPFSYLAKISVTQKTEQTTITKIRTIYKTISQINPKSVRMLAPAPAFHEHTNSGYTWQIVLSSSSRTALLEALELVKGLQNTHISIDPPSLL